MARTIQMRRNKFGQFVASGGRKKASTRRNAPKRKRTRRNPPPRWTAGTVSSNPKRRRPATTRKVARRPSTRRNPPATVSLDRQGRIAGIPVPALADVGYISLGLAGPPAFKGAALRFIPTSFSATQAGAWAIEAGSYAAPVAVGYFVGGARGTRWVIAGEAAGLVVRLASRWTGASLGRMPYAYRGTPGVSGYLNPVASSSLRGGRRGGVAGYLQPVPASGLRGAPANRGARQLFASSTRTRRHSRYN